MSKPSVLKVLNRPYVMGVFTICNASLFCIVYRKAPHSNLTASNLKCTVHYMSAYTTYPPNSRKMSVIRFQCGAIMVRHICK